ncbi:hypothetical protein Oweho_3511 [Owenweeksia hongkongensis DSM 17368]|uniref:Uncharacterized protein n=1 Tax=Owenweeksia hongkongensis (strain DSM 17368 / CIP 108786 / JCM 12287 / NRRL B-23963 / UST20020801) TaxID=926562 RepID=G8R6J6_OWEHD|nr:hypothetical protein [Owenweeksia hongkongensis]AEV34459.1 hypothetical protein Oweho_3511 [Owenweeksia hongkongensis DSM 17368]
MKPILSAIIFIIAFYLSTAQDKSIPFNVSSPSFDSTYMFVSKHSYSSQQIDILEFDNGYKTYRTIEVKRYRPDTTVKTDISVYNLQADTFRSTLTYPVYPEKLKKIRNTIIDTTWSAEDPSIFWTEKTDSIEIDYALSYPLNPETFFKTIRRIEEMADFQGLTIATIYIRFYPIKGHGHPLETIKPDDFNDVDFISTIFLFEKNGLSMDYPIIFE